MQYVKLPRITELNPHLICVLCGGYYIDATSIIECLHAFCKSCIVNYLQTHKYCPICDVQVHKTEPLQNIRPDTILQNIVYKLVPNLYTREMRNRRNFYLNVHPQKRPQNTEMVGEITNASCFYALDDIVNLSLEYIDSSNDNPYYLPVTVSKRYFRCQAIATVKNLRKMLVAKYSLPNICELRFFLDGRQLPEHFKLLDLAYISSWNRNGSIRLFYDILIVRREVIKTEPESVKIAETNYCPTTTSEETKPQGSEETKPTPCEESTAASDAKTTEISAQNENSAISSASNASSHETTLVESLISMHSTTNNTFNVSGTITTASIGISSASVSSVSTITAPIMATGIDQSSTVNGAAASIESTASVPRVAEKQPEETATADVESTAAAAVEAKSVPNVTQSTDAPKLSNGIVTNVTTVTTGKVKSTSALPSTIVSTKPVKPVRISKEVTISSVNNAAAATPSTTGSLKVQRITPPPIFTRNESSSHPVIKTTTCTSKLMSRPWTTTQSAVVSPVIPSPISNSKSKATPKPRIMYKTLDPASSSSSSARLAGNNWIKVKPLGPSHICIPADKTASKGPVLKIDPNTLSPISAAVTSAEAKTSPSGGGAAATASTSNGAKMKPIVTISSGPNFPTKIHPYATPKSHTSAANSNNYAVDSVASYIHPSLIAGSKHLPGLIPYPPLPCEDTLQPMREFVQRMYWYRSGGEFEGVGESPSIDMTKFSTLFGHPMYPQQFNPAAAAAAMSNYRPPPSKRPKYDKPPSTQKPLPPLIRRIMPPTTQTTTTTTTTTSANNVAKGSNNTITNSKANSGRENSKTDRKTDVGGFSISRLTPTRKESKHNAHMCNVGGANRCDQIGAEGKKNTTPNSDKHTKETVKNQFHINNR